MIPMALQHAMIARSILRVVSVASLLSGFPPADAFSAIE
jgi:hypothetical protein